MDLLKDCRSFFSIGKRKTAIAKILITVIKNVAKKEYGFTFSTQFKCNHVTISSLCLKQKYEIVALPLQILKLIPKYYINISVKGGGITSQILAIQLAIARLISVFAYSHKKFIKKALFCRRDSRIKERKKYGLKKARKRSQYTKR